MHHSTIPPELFNLRASSRLLRILPFLHVQFESKGWLRHNPLLLCSQQHSTQLSRMALTCLNIVQFLKPQSFHVCEALRTFPTSLTPAEPLPHTWNYGYLCCAVGSTHILYKILWSFWGQVPDVIITSGEVISTTYRHNQRQRHVLGRLPSSAWCSFCTWTVKLPTWCITMST